MSRFERLGAGLARRLTPLPPERGDPDRFKVVVHELGHLIGWVGLPGAQVDQVEVRGCWNSTTGRVQMVWPDPNTVTDQHARTLDVGYAVGLVTAFVADHVHATHLGRPVDTSGRGSDLDRLADTLREMRRYDRRVTDNELEELAAVVVEREWPRLARLAPTLYHTGVLTPAQVAAA